MHLFQSAARSCLRCAGLPQPVIPNSAGLQLQTAIPQPIFKAEPHPGNGGFALIGHSGAGLIHPQLTGVSAESKAELNLMNFLLYRFISFVYY